MIGVIVATVVNGGWIADALTATPLPSSKWVRALVSPTSATIGNLAAVLLILWALLIRLSGGDPNRRLARTLHRRGDHRGAAQLFFQAGDARKALKLFQEAGDWEGASQAATQLGKYRIAADCLRRAGGRHLDRAARFYHRSGDTDTARACTREMGTWLEAQQRFDEAIDVWLRCGDPIRAAHTASHALNKGRIRAGQGAFQSAVRAARAADNHGLLARLHELEDAWEQAAREWQAAGDASKAAAAFSRAGLLTEAAAAEMAAGNTESSVRLRLAYLNDLYGRLGRMESIPGSEPDKLRAVAASETTTLLPMLDSLGMVSEMIELLKAAGQVEEAVRRLEAAGEPGSAVEIAREAQRWDLAAPILESLTRWGEAGDVYELAGNLEKAARCAERAGEDEKALSIYKSLGRTVDAAHCQARLGALQDALRSLHEDQCLEEAYSLLCSYPGPVPDIPDIILDLAADRKAAGQPEEGIACLQRAVLGVALQPGRLETAVALARELFEVGDAEAARNHVDRILNYDYAFKPARALKAELVNLGSDAVLGMTRPADGSPGGPHPSLSAGPIRYEIRNELGRGGMGVVYLAWDTRLDRDVAIKVLRTTSPEEAAKLELEAKAAATLNHPNIVTVFDFEAGFDGYFIAMELVRGQALDRLSKTAPERIRAQLRSLLVQIASALDYAHRHRIVHRDLKPANILLTDDNTIKILDFGIAARLDRVDGAPHGVCGTPFYMAPEQIRGEAPTPASDIYSLGATAFHLATGRPPFSTGNVIDAHLSLPPPDPRDFAAHLEPRMSDAIRRCLAKKPDDRFSSCAELVRFIDSDV